jgi:dynein heavy chain
MTNVAIKLSNVFNKEKPEKGKKIVPLTGPAKMIDWLSQQLKEYSKNIPVVRIFSNPGMKDWHWIEISKLIDFTINPDQALKLNNIVTKDEVFANLVKLEEIS